MKSYATLWTFLIKLIKAAYDFTTLTFDTHRVDLLAWYSGCNTDREIC